MNTVRIRPRHRIAGSISLAVISVAALAVTRAGAQGVADPHAAHHQPEAAITVATEPDPPAMGENTFTVTVKDAEGKALVGADVTIELVMPAMPMMKMAEMRAKVALKPAVDPKKAADGIYVGKGEIPTAGRWNVTVSVKSGDKEPLTKTLTLRAK